MSLEQGWW